MSYMNGISNLESMLMEGSHDAKRAPMFPGKHEPELSKRRDESVAHEGCCQEESFTVCSSVAV